MAEMLETIEHLATEIGPRPAATEEEQQAALYIADQLEAAGLPAEIEEFQGAISNKKTRLICSTVAVVMALVSLFLPVLALPAVIVSLICAGLFAAEELGKPILSKFLDKGISQNVVARYVPASAQNGNSRRRKVILVARTDSGHVQPELNGALLSAMPILAKASRIGMIALPALLLVKALFFLHSTGVVFVITTVLLILVCLCAALPAIAFALSKASGLTDGANSSASGVAVMLEVARRVNGGNVEVQPVIRGAQAAYEADAVPEGAQLVYEDVAPVAAGAAAVAVAAAAAVDDASQEELAAHEPVVAEPAVQEPVAEETEADRLLAAKAAIAAMTGRPVSDTVSIDLSQPAAQEKAPVAEPAAVAAAVPAAVAAGAAAGFALDAAAGEIVNTASGLDNLVESGRIQEEPEEPAAVEAPVAAPVKNEIPSWFTAGRAAARHREDQEVAPIKRSSHAAALEAAEQRLNAMAYAEAESAVVAPSMEERLQQLQEAAQSVQAPQYDRELVADQPESASEVEEPVAEAAPRLEMVDFAASPLVEAAPELEPEPESEAAPVEEPVSAPEPEPVRVADVVVAPAFSDIELPAEPTPASVAVPEIEEEAEFELEPVVVEPTVVEPAPISMDYFMAAAVGAAAGDTVMMQPVGASEERQPLTLPDLSATGTIPVIDVQKQRAPLAEAESGQGVARGLLTMLPAIDPAAPEQIDLRSTLPSLSGAFVRVPSPNSPSLSQQFEPIAGATGSFAPVTEALVLGADDEEDLFIDDADDSGYEETHTESGAFAGPEYVDMPKKRGFGIFDKLFSRKDKDDAPVAWSDDEDDYRPQSAWPDDDEYEEFEEDFQDDYDDDDYEDDFVYEYDDEDADFSTFFDEEEDEWKGGAFSDKFAGLADGAAGVASKVRGALPVGKGKGEAPAGRGRRRGAAEEPAYEEAGYDEQRAAYEERESRRSARRSENDEYARVYQMIASRYEAEAEGAAEAIAPEANQDADWNNDAQRQISNFRASGIDTEVWFVALGAETDSHAGMSAFIEEHRQELRGAVIVELDSLGSGLLSLVTKEGALQPASASSRMRRYANRASQSSGVPIETASILWGESAASTAIHKGLQAMHLVGMDGLKPSFYAQADDVAENIDPEILAENTNFVVEVLKNI